uniref:Uncharacterized protein n=1 Tax=Manihot esculenta TaxID=3983 RepID=A0A251LKL9_MANES
MVVNLKRKIRKIETTLLEDPYHALFWRLQQYYHYALHHQQYQPLPLLHQIHEAHIYLQLLFSSFDVKDLGIYN